MSKMKLILENWKVFLNEENKNSKQKIKKIVSDAIDNTNQQYLESSLVQRNPSPNSAGSTFLQSQSINSLKNADWSVLKNNPEAISKPAIAFQASIPGKLGAADINDYPDNLNAVIQPAHGGKGIHRDTGKLMAELAAVLPSGAPEVKFTTIILGPSKEDKNKLQVWTFHPGAPIKSGTPIFMDDMKEKYNSSSNYIQIKVGEAKKLGFQFIKHVPKLPSEEEKVKENKLKFNKAFLQKIIKEELLKELMGPPKKPPTKVKPKAKPKPIDKAITFYYLLDDEQENSKLHEYKFSTEQIKNLMDSPFGGTEEEKQTDEGRFLILARKLVNLGDNNYSSGISYSYIKDIIKQIPELSNLKGLNYEFQGTWFGIKHPIFQTDKYKVDPTDSDKKKVDVPPYITFDIGRFKKGGNRYDIEQRPRNLTDYERSALLRGYWRYKVGVKQEQYKSDLVHSHDIEEIKKYIKYLESVREENKDKPNYVKNYTKSINDYKLTLQKSKKVDDKLEIKKRVYYNGFVPICILMEGISRPSKDNPEEYEIINATANYWNVTDAGFKEFKDLKQVGDKFFTESALKTKEIYKDINSVLLSQKPKDVDLKFSRSDMKVKEKINKDEFLQRTTEETPEKNKPEEETPEEDPISDFNKVLKGILPSSQTDQQ